jgi:hypothetical protein
MPSPLSLDLRQKIIEVHTEEDISQRQLAERFRVSLRASIIVSATEGPAVEARASLKPGVTPDYKGIGS